MADGGRARSRGLGSGSLLMSLVVHGLALFALWGLESLKAEIKVYETIAVRLVSAPPATAPDEEDQPPAPEEELVVETPLEPEPVPEEEAPIVQEEPEPDPEPEETPPQPVEEPPPPTEAPPSQAPSENEDPRQDGGEDLNVRLEGLRRDYPAYYGNIITQMRRCFRPPQGDNREATVRFLIHRDGSTSEFETVRSSGSFAFDVEAQGAVECAGRPGRIGPLPEDFPWDALPIEFTFRPRGG